MFQIPQTQIESLFHLRQTEAAAYLGISLTAMKAACRRVGISKWPYSRIRPKAVFRMVSPTAAVQESSDENEESTTEYSPSPSKSATDADFAKQGLVDCSGVEHWPLKSAEEEHTTNPLHIHADTKEAGEVLEIKSEAHTMEEQGKDVSQGALFDFPFEPLDASWISAFMNDSLGDD
ncbi:hypothetical protein GUITHDRAFT_116989 [Guillardia theta CCMP2712]|uniref:RWP-RK domain-containing protein n=1 Tax=Guillardia theta (strain CCMP2712) TaxID=905079 RepID=L1IKQ4_GUITC|nr:hypothetical protein GUITHDRAFT_116989 [Guillardia theta CCMP2712]EKX36823.1 hypothetical protein GUITHDRAFT_116989 [Guillardia theta CCMP2712]|eukprot:XP_005823803.1 hypothetical protein GUITHDRAFT_116989 [Guillardia theta CCMP2712]